MPDPFISAYEGLKEIEVPCLNERCGVKVKAMVSLDHKGKLRKFCHNCRRNT